MPSMIAVVSHTKNVMTAPSYAYTIEDNDDNGFTYQTDHHYSIVWLKESKLYAYNALIELMGEIEFGNEGIHFGVNRRFVNINKYDEGDNAFTYIYYPKTKDLYCIALSADEAIFGGIVVTPALDHPLV